jgi:hypothetical protein
MRKNIFADKATFVLRKMLEKHEKKWVVRDFVSEKGISQGLVQGVLETMEKKGYIERFKRGPQSFSKLTNENELIKDWTNSYSFEKNEENIYYSPDKTILSKLKDQLEDKPYALTLHSGANLVTSYVVTDQIYFYFNSQNWKEDVIALRERLDLKELVRGGNIHIIRPHYKNSIFYNIQTIRGFRVVSNLQLYLDLYNFVPRGREHAEYLEKVHKEKGNYFYES